MNTTPSTPLRAVVSARVSVDDFGKGKKTKDQQAQEASISIEAQTKTGVALIAQHGYVSVCDPLVDDGVSGFKGAERAGFVKLMSLIIGGRVDVVVTRAVDRIGRNDADNSAIRIAAAEHGVRFHLTSGSVIDPRVSGDKLNLQIIQGLAEYQSALKSETLRNVYGAMRDRGELRSGHKAFGWQWEKGKPELSMLAEPGERTLVQEAYRRVLGGETLYAICADWDRRGIPTVGKSTRWSTQAVRSMLLRPSNALFVRNGNGFDYFEDKRGKWDRLIDDEKYLQARALLLSPSRRTAPGRKSVHLVPGIVRCGLCGGPMRSSSVDDKAGGRIPIYRCVNKLSFPTDPGVKHVSARIAPLDAAVRKAVIDAFVFGPDNLFPDAPSSRAGELHSELDEVIAAQTRLQELVTLGVREPIHVAPDMRKLNAQASALRAELETAQASEVDSMTSLSNLRAGLWHPDKVADIDAAALYADSLGARFDALPIDKRRALVRHLLYVEVRPLAPGVYGSRRWLIAHRRATSLNGEAESQAVVEAA